MTPEAFKKLEVALGVHLPEGYLQFMTESFEQVMAPEFLDKNPFVFIREPNHLQKFNEILRSDQASYFLDGLPWPTHFFAFGEDRNGAIYALDVTQDNEMVWEYHDDPGLMGQVAFSVTQFAEELQQKWVEAQNQKQQQSRLAEERLKRRLEQNRKKKSSS